MGDRRQKRAWLRLIGAIDDYEPSGSAAKVLTPSLVDSTLGSIQTDDVWVALACLDAIENKAEVTLDLVLTKHLLMLGLQRTSVHKEVDLESKQERHKLATRKVLLRYMRMLDVWVQVYSVEAEKRMTYDDSGKESPSTHDDEGDFDAWEEVAGPGPDGISSPSKSISLLRFIQESPLEHAKQLASSGQDTRLTAYIQALPDTILKVVFPHRLAITKKLLSSSAVKTDLSRLLRCRLLPGLSNAKESDLWTDCESKSQYPDDVTDGKDVCDTLSSHHLIRFDDSQDSAMSQAIYEDLTPDSLLSFYKSCIDEMEEQSPSSSIQLTNILLSEELNLPANEDFARLAADLQLLQPLIHGPSSSRHCSNWTLRRFREELSSRPELSQKQAMATLYLEEVKSETDAIKATKEGVMPFLRSITQRYSLQVDDSTPSDQPVADGFLQAVLALADKGQIKIVTLLLMGSAKKEAGLSLTEQAKAALACLLVSSQTDIATQREANYLAASTLANLEGVPMTGQERPLRDCVGAALQRHGRPLAPSQLFRFFTHLELPAVRHYIERCQLFLLLCDRLTKWNSALTVSWLFSAQGQHEEQASYVNRIVRSFAREHKTQNQWTSLTGDLLDNVGKSGSFDALDERDIVRLVAEGALRTGDAKIYSYVMKEHASQLSSVEQEDLILIASREFYDNSTSTNVHQGDMKTAHDILLQCGHLSSTRIEQEKAFIEATSRLCSFRIQSMLRPGIPLAPIEIRIASDRMTFIKRLLETKEDAYKSPDLVLELAQKLCAIPGGSDGKEIDKVPSRPLIESRTLALLTEAALGQTDYTYAQSSCERLVANVAKLEKRVEQSAVSQGKQHDHLQEVLIQVRESAYRSCFLLCNQHEWKDHGSRLTWCSYVLAYCPSDQIERYLKTWRQLEESFQQDLLDNPPKDWDQVAIQLKSGHGGLASSLASIGGLGAFESLSPFGTLFASARNTPSPLSRGRNQDESKQSATQHTKDDTLPPRLGSPSSRAARLFDSLGGTTNNASGEGTYLDPAERAARAARRFFGGFGS